jgi:hypothetical protein
MTRTEYINNLIQETQESEANFRLSQARHKLKQDTLNNGINIIMQQMSYSTLAAFNRAFNGSI